MPDPKANPKDVAASDRIGLNDDGSLDEIVLTGMAHLEQMNKGSFYLGLYRPDGSGIQVWLSAKKGKLQAHYEEFEATTPTQPPPITGEN